MKKFVLIIVLISGLVLCSYPEGKKGQWEMGYHYSYWSINIMSSFFEDNLISEFENYDLEKGGLHFDSDGANYGFELRFFPKGKNGAFSIGVSYERNNFDAKIDGSYSELDDFNNRVDVEAVGTIKLRPHSFNLSIRWDLWPFNRVHPYLGLGFGLGPVKGNIKLHTTSTTFYGGYTHVEETDEEKTIKQALEELEEEGKGFPLSIFPIVHLYAGLRGEVLEDVYLLGEIAIYDGIIFRGGIAVRF